MTNRDAHPDADAPASADTPSEGAPTADAVTSAVAAAEAAIAASVAAGMRSDEFTADADDATEARTKADDLVDGEGPGDEPEESSDAEDVADTGESPEVALDEDASSTATADAADSESAVADASDSLTPDARWADGTSHATALTWVDPIAVVAVPSTQPDEDRTSVFTGAKLRGAGARPGVLVPLGILVGLACAYAGSTLLWPLNAIAPSVAAADVQVSALPFATPTWPTQGSAAIGIEGIGTVSSTSDAAGIASVTKVVTTLMVLEKLPLAVGEQGPEYAFTKQDSLNFWTYRKQNQSSLDVPVGGVLTEYQMLQGTLLGSANNYIDRLAREIWGSDRAFADAAQAWLRDRGLTGITVVTPSGFDERNRATPESLLKLSELAMKNPVFAEIVGTESVELPGAGLVKNTNGMLKDDGVVGIKTGTLEYWNILTAKDVTVGETTVRLYAAVLGQDSNDDRLAATRTLFSEAEAALDDQPTTVPEGTVVGEARTVWGTEVDVVTESDAEVVLWDSAVPKTSTAFDLGDRNEDGDRVGTLTTTGPLNSVETPLVLADDLDGPSPWWRLTHPLELFGITEAKR